MEGEFGIRVDIPPYEDHVCANSITENVPVNKHVVLACKHRLKLCSLDDYTFHRENCKGNNRFVFQLNSTSLSNNNDIFNSNLPPTQRLFKIISSSNGKAIHVNKNGLVRIPKETGRESLFYLKRLMY